VPANRCDSLSPPMESGDRRWIVIIVSIAYHNRLSSSVAEFRSWDGGVAVVPHCVLHAHCARFLFAIMSRGVIMNGICVCVCVCARDDRAIEPVRRPRRWHAFRLCARGCSRGLRAARRASTCFAGPLRATCVCVSVYPTDFEISSFHTSPRFIYYNNPVPDSIQTYSWPVSTTTVDIFSITKCQ
jgi:hypothetical protein